MVMMVKLAVMKAEAPRAVTVRRMKRIYLTPWRETETDRKRVRARERRTDRRREGHDSLYPDPTRMAA